MSESTGGHHLDTGDGPPTVPDVVEPTRPTVVWNAYQTHRRSCSQCQTSVWRCAEGNELWNAVIS